MKIIHCADLHLDSRMTSALTAEQASRRRNELLSTYLRMVDYAETNGVEAILIAGDLFDGKRISAQARNTVLESMVTHPEITFFYLSGNHEGDAFIKAAAGRPEGCPENLRTFGKRWTHYELKDSSGEDAGAVRISGIELGPENAGTAYATLMTGTGKYQIVMLHGQLAEYPSRERAEIIHLGALRNRRIDYLALGHIHSHKEGELPPGGFWCYPGCLEGRGFDECGEHGFVLLDIDPVTRTAERTFIPFASREVMQITADITGCMNTLQILNAVKRTLHALAAEEGTDAHAGARKVPAPGDMVKFVLTGETDVECEKNLGQLDRMLEEEFFAVRIEDRSRTVIDYRSYAMDASLKGEFVRLVQADEDLAEEEKAEIIRCGILALAGEELSL